MEMLYFCYMYYAVRLMTIKYKNCFCAQSPTSISKFEIKYDAAAKNISIIKIPALWMLPIAIEGVSGMQRMPN